MAGLHNQERWGRARHAAWCFASSYVILLTDSAGSQCSCRNVWCTAVCRCLRVLRIVCAIRVGADAVKGLAGGHDSRSKAAVFPQPTARQLTASRLHVCCVSALVQRTLQGCETCGRSACRGVVNSPVAVFVVGGGCMLGRGACRAASGYLCACGSAAVSGSCCVEGAWCWRRVY
jgi:hypothetical protein